MGALRSFYHRPPRGVRRFCWSCLAGPSPSSHGRRPALTARRMKSTTFALAHSGCERVVVRWSVASPLRVYSSAVAPPSCPRLFVTTGLVVAPDARVLSFVVIAAAVPPFQVEITLAGAGLATTGSYATVANACVASVPSRRDSVRERSAAFVPSLGNALRKLLSRNCRRRCGAFKKPPDNLGEE